MNIFLDEVGPSQKDSGRVRRANNAITVHFSRQYVGSGVETLRTTSGLRLGSLSRLSVALTLYAIFTLAATAHQGSRLRSAATVTPPGANSYLTGALPAGASAGRPAPPSCTCCFVAHRAGGGASVGTPVPLADTLREPKLYITETSVLALDLSHLPLVISPSPCFSVENI